ncbi:polyphenol oxidase, chloroplastic-like [Dioscorea cayenensis subsp. rotundata]|uniref:Polyphenol oxidase, chloroplastic-like n=1 Tax=Dioscorea cayennensis subsp. rotundata TaxID=55577 RepID=A0AB40CL24_DIOCR|nr:polyphenol oxidase, chloroplastic-like [Dioscorea cayenensis subsp. rotundata]
MSTIPSLTIPISSPSSFACSFINKTTPSLSIPRRNRRGHSKSSSSRTTTCNMNQENNYKLDRRDVLIGLGGLYGTTAGLILTGNASGAPIQAADPTKCGPADLPAGATPTDCCPPAEKVIDFVLPPSSDPLRVRRAAHLVDKDYIAKYTKAVELMKALPADDPRNFTQQANIHCAYCNGSFDQIGFPNVEIQVHDSWVFFPWHRFYLYFHEKILGKLIGDESFALPFWNWDSPAGYQIPAMYTNTKSSLYDKLRDAKHQPPALVDLNFNGTDLDLTQEQRTKRNLALMYRQVVTGGKTAELFMGSPYRAGDAPAPGAGTLENAPHGTVHVWTGDRTQPNTEDMGTLYSSARDPIFYAHHSNVDRMWNVWKSLGGKRKDFTDSDWLNTSFLFYNENAELVKVKIKDTLDPSKLRFTYQDVEVPWLKARPTPAVATKEKATVKSRALKVFKGPPTFPVTLDSPVSVTVKRPKPGRSQKEKEDEEEVLVVEGLEFDRDLYVKFDVYVNTPEEEGVAPGSSEFAGSFVNVPRKHQPSKGPKTLKTNFKIGITDLLEELECEGDESVVVTLVAKSAKGKIKVGGVKIVFSS